MNQEFTNLTYPKITGGTFTMHVGQCKATLPYNATKDEIGRAYALISEWNDDVQRLRQEALRARPWWRRLFGRRPRSAARSSRPPSRRSKSTASVTVPVDNRRVGEIMWLVRLIRNRKKGLNP